MLSKSGEAKCGLDERGRIGRTIVGSVEPCPQIPMHKEVEAQQCDEVRETPADAAAQLQELQQQDGNECCPNLNAHRVGTGANEGLDLEVLFERFKEQFDLPALLVNGGDGRRTEFAVVG